MLFSRSPHRAGVAGLLIVLITVLSSCSSGTEAMTEDDIVERVASAQREAPTFTFTWVTPSETDELTTTGALRYDDEGELDAMRIRTTDASDEVTEDYRLIDGTLYTSTPEGRYTPAPEEEAEAIVNAWDWAAATEMWGKPKSVSEKSNEEVDGVETTAYEVVFEADSEDLTQTWWVDDKDRLLRFESGEGGVLSVGTVADYGQDVEITVPSDLIDD
jgi:hypothetical protein